MVIFVDLYCGPIYGPRISTEPCWPCPWTRRLHLSQEWTFELEKLIFWPRKSPMWAHPVSFWIFNGLFMSSHISCRKAKLTYKSNLNPKVQILTQQLLAEVSFMPNLSVYTLYVYVFSTRCGVSSNTLLFNTAGPRGSLESFSNLIWLYKKLQNFLCKTSLCDPLLRTVGRHQAFIQVNLVSLMLLFVNAIRSKLI